MGANDSDSGDESDNGNRKSENQDDGGEGRILDLDEIGDPEGSIDALGKRVERKRELGESDGDEENG